MNLYYNDDFGFSYVDEFGNPVEKTKDKYPYSYDGYVSYRNGDNSDITGSVYSDRLRQWDYEKYEECSKKHGDPGLMRNKVPIQIQSFLRDYLNEPKLNLILIMEYCNLSTGYPVWRFDYQII